MWQCGGMGVSGTLCKSFNLIFDDELVGRGCTKLPALSLNSFCAQTDLDLRSLSLANS